MIDPDPAAGPILEAARRRLADQQRRPGGGVPSKSGKVYGFSAYPICIMDFTTFLAS